jgi:uncharacterized protein HemY
VIYYQAPQQERSLPNLPTGSSQQEIDARMHYLVQLEQAMDWDGLELVCLHWIKSHPEDPSAYYGLGGAHAGRKNYNKAIEFFRKAVELKPDFSRCWWLLGTVYYRLHDNKGVAECMKELHKIDPSIARAFRRQVLGLQ